jgi:hypothetical protein
MNQIYYIYYEMYHSFFIFSYQQSAMKMVQPIMILIILYFLLIIHPNLIDDMGILIIIYL